MPLSSEKNDVSSFSQSPLIRYLSNLQVTNEDWHKNSNEFQFGPDRVFYLELFALECWLCS